MAEIHNMFITHLADDCGRPVCNTFLHNVRVVELGEEYNCPDCKQLVKKASEIIVKADSLVDEEYNAYKEISVNDQDRSEAAKQKYLSIMRQRERFYMKLPAKMQYLMCMLTAEKWAGNNLAK